MSTTSVIPSAHAVPASSSADPSTDKHLTIERMLLPLDFSDECLQAVEYAAPLARRFGAEMHLVYVGENHFSEISLTPPVLSEPELIEQLRTRVRERMALDIPAQHCHVRSGQPFRQITDLAATIGANLVVLSRHSGRALEHLLRGSTADRVMRHSPVPVLVVEPGNKPPVDPATGQFSLRTILVPVDFSACAAEGAQYAAEFAGATGADLLLLHVVEPPSLIGADLVAQPHVWPQVEREALIAAEDKLDELLNSLEIDGLEAETKVTVGIAAAEIARETERDDVEMVITSTHGRTGLRHLLLGSTAKQLMHLAKCPVLVVPSRTT